MIKMCKPNTGILFLKLIRVMVFIAATEKCVKPEIFRFYIGTEHQFILFAFSFLKCYLTKHKNKKMSLSNGSEHL